MGRKARSYTGGPAVKVQLKITKGLKYDLAGGRGDALASMAQRGGEMLHARAEAGRQWDGRPVPIVKPGMRRRVARSSLYFVAKSDPRIGTLGTHRLKPWNMKGQKGRPQWWVFRGTYGEFKVALGKRATKGASLTGAMWRSLTARVRDAKSGGAEIRLYFAGSSPSSYVQPGGGVGRVRFRNRDKARLLQYEGRSGVGQHENAGGRQFELMRLAPGELDELAGMFIGRVRLA